MSRKWLLSKFLIPLSDYYRGTSTLKKYKFLMESQWWSKEKIEELQNKKLTRLISYAYVNVPFYRKVFKTNNIFPEDIKTHEDLVKIPPLTKDMVRNYGFTDLLSTCLPKKRRYMGRTGGSTGEPLRFWRDKDSGSWAWGAMYRFWGWAGLQIWDKKFSVFGGSLGGFLTNKSRIRLSLEKFLTGTVPIISAFDLLEENMKSCVTEIQSSTDIHYIRGYASALFILAKYINSQNYEILNIKGILTTADNLYPSYREEIEKAFNCNVYDQYGSGEIYAIAGQCDKASFYHVFDEHVIVENKVTSETEKNALITDLDNYASPFIRYDLGDVIVESKESCDCGRNLSTIREIKGRVQDYIVTSNGNLITGNFFPHIFQTVKGIDQFQIIQEEIDFLKLLVKPNKYYTEEEMKTYSEKIKTYVGENALIEVIQVNEIPVLKSGKRAIVQSKVEINFN